LIAILTHVVWTHTGRSKKTNLPFFFIGALGKQNLQIMLAEVSAAAFMTWNAQGPS
jgi:hypothetical protein